MGGVRGPPPATSEALLCHSLLGALRVFSLDFFARRESRYFLKKKISFVSLLFGYQKTGETIKKTPNSQTGTFMCTMEKTDFQH